MTGQLYLAHHGIKGMKWGVRRFQNRDGSLTSAGQKRYAGNSTLVSTQPTFGSEYTRKHGINPNVNKSKAVEWLEKQTTSQASRREAKRAAEEARTRPTVAGQRRIEQKAAKEAYKQARVKAKQDYKDAKKQAKSEAAHRAQVAETRYKNAAESYTASKGERAVNALLLSKEHRVAYNAMRSQDVSRGAAYASIFLTGSHGAKSRFEQEVVAEEKKR